MDLDRKVFGRITTKEIVGADPPALQTRVILEREMAELLSELESAGRQDLEDLLEEQGAADACVNSRPGAMALAQSKIQMFNEFSRRYSDAIRGLLDCGSSAPTGAESPAGSSRTS